jgi:hypothetical protein
MWSVDMIMIVKSSVTRITFLTFAFLFLSLNSIYVQANESSLSTAQTEARKGGYQLIDLDGLWSLYQNNKEGLLLIDTRQEWEYHSGYIQGAVNFPMEPTWLARMTQRGSLEQFLGPDKERALVFY